ncbi:MAG TPA: ATP-binding protein [bacterium]|nr:ATP-binding protein [bacterium]
MRLNLRKKILLGFGISLVFSIIVMLWAIYNLYVLGNASKAILSENYKSIIAAEHMIDSLERQDSAMLIFLLEERESAIRQFNEATSDFWIWFGRARDNITIPGESDIVESIHSLYGKYIESFSGAHSPEDAHPAFSFQYYNKVVFALFESIRAELSNLRELNQRTMYEASDRTERLAVNTIMSMSVVGSLAIAVGIVFSLLLSRRIVHPLIELTAATERISGGDYDVHIEAESNDELGVLADSFAVMATRLKSFNDLNIGKIIHEKKKSDTLIRSIHDGIVLIDKSLRIVNANPAAQEALGFSFDEKSPMHFLEAFDNAELFSYIKATSESGVPPVIPEEKTILTIEKNGVIAHYSFTITPVLLGEHESLGVVLLLQDITALTNLDQLKTEFVMTASHELKSPLTSIAISLDLLTEGLGDTVDEKHREVIEAANEDVNRLKALVSDLLDLSRLESGKAEMDLARYPVRDIMEQACSIMRRQVEEKSLTLRCDLPDVTMAMMVDGNKIVWILTNLLANAIRYTNEGGTISVSAEEIGHFVYIKVKDTGVGIPPEYQRKIFEKFVQVKGAAKPGGTGLGLAICREIVRAHGGRIWVESEVGSGSTFTFTLPSVLEGGQSDENREGPDS